MEFHKGDTVETYIARAMLLRDVLPIDRTSDADFIEKAMAVLARNVQANIVILVQKRVRRLRERQRRPPTLHELQGEFADARRELCGSLPLQAVSPASTGGAPHEEIAKLKKELKRVNALIAQPATAANLHAMTAPPPKSVHYSNEERSKLMSADRCFKCGKVGHIRPACPNRMVDMRAELALIN
jgi:hypothetical protein